MFTQLGFLIASSTQARSFRLNCLGLSACHLQSTRILYLDLRPQHSPVVPLLARVLGLAQLLDRVFGLQAKAQNDLNFGVSVLFRVGPQLKPVVARLLLLAFAQTHAAHPYH